MKSTTQVQQEAMYHSHCHTPIGAQQYTQILNRLWNPQNNKTCTKPQNVNFDRAEVEQYGKGNIRYVQLVTIMVFTQKGKNPSLFPGPGFFSLQFFLLCIMRGTGSIQSIDVYDYERKTVLIPSTSELKQPSFCPSPRQQKC